MSFGLIWRLYKHKNRKKTMKRKKKHKRKTRRR